MTKAIQPDRLVVPPRRLVDDKAASAYLGICRRSLWTLANSGQIRFCKINRLVRYDVNDLDAFIESTKQTRGASSQPDPVDCVETVATGQPTAKPHVRGLHHIGDLLASSIRQHGIDEGTEP